MQDQERYSKSIEDSRHFSTDIFPRETYPKTETNYQTLLRPEFKIDYVTPIKPTFLLLEQVDIPQSLDQKISIQAAIGKVRKKGSVSFVTIETSDSTSSLQAIIETPKGEVRDQFQSLDLKEGSIIRIEGIFSRRPQENIKNTNDDNLFDQYELKSTPSDIKVLSQIEIAKTGLRWEDAMKGHLNSEDYGEIIRLPEFKRIMTLRSSIKDTFLNYFKQKGFMSIDVSSLTSSISESGAEVLSVNSRAGEMSLIQSPQQIKQIMAGILGKVVWVGQAFRNDPSATAHHLTEFTGMDTEFQILTNDKRSGMMSVMNELQGVITALINEINTDSRVFIDNNTTPPKPITGSFPVLKFEEAIKIAKTSEFDRKAEKIVAQYIEQTTGSEFYFITDFPDKEKPFYTDVVEDDTEHTYSFDLIYRGVEISSGGLRVNDPSILKRRLIEKGYNPKDFVSYLDNFSRGTAQTGGFGIGLERFIANSLGGINVRLTIPFPKTSDLILG